MKQIVAHEEITRCLQESHFQDFFSFSVMEDVCLFLADKGDHILKEGMESDGFLYYMVSGRAKVYCNLSNGKPFLLDFLKGRCFIGELEFLHVRKSTMGVKALSPCLLLALPIKKYADRLLSDVRFLKLLAISLATKEEQRVLALSSTQGFPLANRLADFILFASIDKIYTETNTNASAYLGVSYRHLTQILGEFTDNGYLRKTQIGYYITNETALKQLAEELDIEQ